MYLCWLWVDRLPRHCKSVYHRYVRMMLFAVSPANAAYWHPVLQPRRQRNPGREASANSDGPPLRFHGQSCDAATAVVAERPCHRLDCRVAYSVELAMTDSFRRAVADRSNLFQPFPGRERRSSRMNWNAAGRKLHLLLIYLSS